MSETQVRALVAAAIVALAAIIGYALHVANEKRAEQRAIAALVGAATEQLKQALAAGAPAGDLARADANLQALRDAKAARQKELADAAEHYLISARTIMRARADATRLAQQAAASRQGLAAHMGARRDKAWFAHAMEIKKRVEQDYFDLALAYKALDDVFYSLPEDVKRLARSVDPSLLLDEPLAAAARKQAQDEAARAAEQLAQARRLAERR